MSENNMTYDQGYDVPHPDRARDREPHVVGRRQLGDSSHPDARQQTKAS